MTSTIANNQIFIKIEQNFEPMVAYLYLMAFEFVSNGLFVPSINPPSNSVYMPQNFIGKEQTISYFKTMKILVVNKTELILTFDTIDDATAFKDSIDQSW